MADNVTIFKVDTGEAVTSVNDLKNNIKQLKSDLSDLEIGSQEYQSTLTELKVNQAALKDAMYATSSTMEEVASNAKGLNVTFDEQNKLLNKGNQSYNALVNRMAELKTQWRATSDEAKRAELGEQIKQINDELKGMDASVGNFSRSVGDYTNSVKKALGDFPSFADPAKKAIKGVNDTMSLVASNPVMGIIALLTPLVMQITSSLKESESSMGAINKVMTSLQPIMDFFQAILGKVVDYLAVIINKVGEMIGSSGIINKVVDALAGVGNAILKFVVSPFKGVAAAIGVFQEEGVSGLRNAAKAFANEMKSGVSFKSNYDAGTAAVEGMLKGVEDKKADVEKAGKTTAKWYSDAFEKEIDNLNVESDIKALVKEMEDEAAQAQKISDAAEAQRVKNQDNRLKNLDKMAAHVLKVNQSLVDDESKRAELAYEIQRDADQQKLALLQEFAQNAMEAGNLDEYLNYQQQASDLEVQIEERALTEKQRIRQKDKKDKEKNAKDIIAATTLVGNATASVLGSIADMYEQDEENAEKNAVKVKALRISESVISTLTGAIGAFMQASATLPPPAGPILGAISAAAVTAAGVAQIAQIAKTPIGSKGAGGSTPAVSVQAPSVPTDVTQVRAITSESEEQRLNDMAADQRVYILSSDIEASQNHTKVQVAETSW